MPYTKQERRPLIGMTIEPDNSGELNYALTSIIYSYYKRHGGKYAQVNDVVGALEGAKLEFYRRIAAPYEDKKIIENGDVYE